MDHLIKVTPVTYDTLLGTRDGERTELSNSPQAVPHVGDWLQFQEVGTSEDWTVGRTLYREVLAVTFERAPYGQHPDAVRWTAKIG